MTASVPILLCGAIAISVSAMVWLAPDPESALATYATPLEGRMRSQRQNAVRCALELNGAVIGPHDSFSFNNRVGTWTRDQGYRKAPVSYNGQLISSWGGGVCQTSTTLYNAALLAGMAILERHPHRFAPSYVPPGRDAAVAFSDVDLRFANPYEFPVRIECRVDANRLAISLHGSGKAKGVRLSQEIREIRPPKEHVIVGGTSAARVRNTGKNGYEVVTWRWTDGRKELVTTDSYPAMQRIVERR